VERPLLLDLVPPYLRTGNLLSCGSLFSGNRLDGYDLAPLSSSALGDRPGCFSTIFCLPCLADFRLLFPDLFEAKQTSSNQLDVHGALSPIPCRFPFNNSNAGYGGVPAVLCSKTEMADGVPVTESPIWGIQVWSTSPYHDRRLFKYGYTLSSLHTGPLRSEYPPPQYLPRPADRLNT